MIQKLLIFAVFAFFVACSDENPFEAMEDDLHEVEADAYSDAYADRIKASSSSMSMYDQCMYGYYTASYCCTYYGYRCSYVSSSSSYMSEADKCYYGTSTYSDSYCCTNYGYRCSYVSSSSSYMSEADKCYYGTSTYSDSYCCTNYGYRCSYVSSSSSYRSSSSSATAYLTRSKTMKLTLTYYKQKSSDWDLGGSSDGDPSISFVLYFIYSGGGDSTKVSTGTLLSLQDQGSWTGSKSSTLTIPMYIEDVKICPNVIDKDVLSNDDYSSGYCYNKYNIGYLDSYSTVYQSDYYSSHYELEWEWYLY